MLIRCDLDKRIVYIDMWYPRMQTFKQVLFGRGGVGEDNSDMALDKNHVDSLLRRAR